MSSQLFGQAVIDNLLASLQRDSLLQSQDGRYSASLATEPSQNKKTQSGGDVTRLFHPSSNFECKVHKGAEEYCTSHCVEYAIKQEKLRPSLLPVEGTIEGIKAMEFGAKKYGDHAWKTAGVSKQEFLDALERHLLALKQGESHAPDSQVHHLGHIIANASIILSKFKE
jgi:hypothetical protein